MNVLTVGGLAALGLLAGACHKSSPAASRPPPAVTANQPVQREVVEWDEYPGRLEAVDMVEVHARVNGEPVPKSCRHYPYRYARRTAPNVA